MRMKINDIRIHETGQNSIRNLFACETFVSKIKNKKRIKQ